MQASLAWSKVSLLQQNNKVCKQVNVPVKYASSLLKWSRSERALRSEDQHSVIMPLQRSCPGDNGAFKGTQRPTSKWPPEEPDAEVSSQSISNLYKLITMDMTLSISNWINNIGCTTGGSVSFINNSNFCAFDADDPLLPCWPPPPPPPPPKPVVLLKVEPEPVPSPLAPPPAAKMSRAPQLPRAPPAPATGAPPRPNEDKLPPKNNCGKLTPPSSMRPRPRSPKFVEVWRSVAPPPAPPIEAEAFIEALALVAAGPDVPEAELPPAVEVPPAAAAEFRSAAESMPEEKQT
mmetsp:Transcript_49259/g.141387  ORF Transcript_49259/g.141387 Transcript_49259/m.141387 type:complete len:291 (-) Transcript_49259:107-979(-)